MTGRLVVLPRRRDILLRSVGYGTGCGAAAGALIVALPAALATPYALGLLFLTPISATVGAIFGLVCGLTGGVGLVIVRRHLSGSRGAVRVVAGLGSGLAPAICMAALMTGSGRAWQPALAALTAVTAMLAGALGPYAFFGRPRRRRQRIAYTRESGRRREMVG